MTDAPRNIDELRAIKDPEELVRAAKDFIQRVEDTLTDARAARDTALAQLAEKHGPAKTQRMTGIALSTINNALKVYRATKRK
jgi:hypothetical protein